MKILELSAQESTHRSNLSIKCSKTVLKASAVAQRKLSWCLGHLGSLLTLVSNGSSVSNSPFWLVVRVLCWPDLSSYVEWASRYGLIRNCRHTKGRLCTEGRRWILGVGFRGKQEFVPIKVSTVFDVLPCLLLYLPWAIEIFHCSCLCFIGK